VRDKDDVAGAAGVVATLEATTDAAVAEADAADTAGAVTPKPQLQMAILSQIQMMVMAMVVLHFPPYLPLDLACTLVIIEIAPSPTSPTQMTRQLPAATRRR
jgi:hypothetical protein